MIARTPEPPYYAVIFTSLKTGVDEEEYSETANEMVEMAKLQPGFLGMETARNEIGITVSYWKSLEDIRTWKDNTSHLIAQQKGKEKWYEEFTTRICLVEREYSFKN